MACQILHSSWMESEETIDQDEDMFPELNGHTTLQDKLNADKKAADNMDVQQTDSEELSSDECAAFAAATVATVVDGAGNAKDASSTVQSDLEITLNDESELNNEEVDNHVEINDNLGHEPGNKDHPELANNAQPELATNDEPELANLVPEIRNDDTDSELDPEEEQRKKEVEKAKKETKKNNRNFQRKLMNLKNDVENIQMTYGGDTEYILFIKDTVTKSNGSAGRECHTAGRILITGEGELFDSFSSGELKYNPKTMMVLEEGKKLKSKNEEFMLDWVAKKGLIPDSVVVEQPVGHPHAQAPLLQQPSPHIQILPLALSSAILSSFQTPEQHVGASAALTPVASTPPTQSRTDSSSNKKPVQRKEKAKKRKNDILESDESSDIPYDDTSDDDSVLDGMEKAIAAINERRAEARAKRSRIVVADPPVDSSSDESVDSGCEQRGAGASKGKKKKKPTKAAASRKKNLSKNDILPPQPAVKKPPQPAAKKPPQPAIKKPPQPAVKRHPQPAVQKPPQPAVKKVATKKKPTVDQNDNTKKVMKPSDDVLVRNETNIEKPKEVKKVGGDALVLKDLHEILDHAKAIKPKDAAGVASGQARKVRLAKHQIRDLLDSPKAGPSGSQDKTPIRTRNR